jgi:voltage-gated potassium channel Kch
MAGFLSSPLRNLLAGIAYVAVVSSAATAAFIAQGWSLPDAFYMVITTIFTVGYGEIHPIDTPLLRAITITLIVTGCTGMIFVTGALVQLITASQFQQLLGSRRMQKDIDALAGHVIICGYGRIGQMLARELRDGRRSSVILERDTARVDLARAQGFLAMAADATDEDALRLAGLTRARVLATVLPDDAANVFITLSARSLNRELTIIARGEAPSTERKLLQAGANRVVLPAHIGAERVAELILFQDVAGLLEAATARTELARDLRHLGLELEIWPAATGSPCVGLTITELQARAAGAFMVVALKSATGAPMTQPEPNDIITAGDAVAVLRRGGNTAAIEALFAA